MAFQDFQLIVSGWITHGHLHQETVELCLWQTIGTLLLHWVLGGEDGIEVSHRISDTIHAHLSFFHHLKQCRLGLGWSTVDFIDQDNVGEDWALMELKLLGLDIEDVGTQHITRHQVGGKLHATELGIDQSSYQSS